MLEAENAVVVSDVQAAVIVLRRALDAWSNRTLAELIVVSSYGEVRGQIDVAVLGDVAMGLPAMAEELGVRIDAIDLLVAFISSDSG